MGFEVGRGLEGFGWGEGFWGKDELRGFHGSTTLIPVI